MEFRDLKAQYQRYRNEIASAVHKVIMSTDFIEGNAVRVLEERLAEYVGVKHCITCANGTDAMNLMMMAWEIKKGDAVFVPDFTFFSTAEVVAYRGATPVFVDVNKATFNIDTVKLEKVIKQTLQEGKLLPRAIIPVDLFGLPADHYELDRIARKYKLLILEDAAQGFGGNINGKRACSFGNAAATSFFPSKPLGCYGDGGAIFTNDNHLSELLTSLKIHGKGDSKYDNVRIGVNSRLDTIQAAILNVKLAAFLAHELDDVNRIYKLYNDRLKGYVEIPAVPEGYTSSFAQYTIKLRSKAERNTVQAKLRDNGIPSCIYYIKPMHKQMAFKELRLDDKDFETTNEICNTVLSLPMHPYLTEADVVLVSDVIRDCVTENEKNI